MFENKARLEEEVNRAEAAFDDVPNKANRTSLHQAQAELRSCLHKEEIFWGKKAKVNWLQLGDRNTKFYHLYVKQRRSCMTIHRINLDNGLWCEDQAVLKDKAVEYYE